MIIHSPRLRLRSLAPPAAPVALRRLLYVFSLLTGCATAMPGFALTLGGINEQSQLGQPFRIVVPVVGQPADELSGECVKVVASRTKGGDDIPEVSSATVALERAGPSTRLVVTSRRPVNDPVVRITLQANCQQQEMRREYLMLLDPPIVDAPVVGENADAAVSIAAAASTPQGAVATLSVTFPAQVESVAAVDDASKAAVTPRSRSGERKAAAGTDMPRKRPLTKNDGPRLAVSHAVPEIDATRPEGFARMSKSAQLAAVEEQEVVLRKRVEELTGLVERMQQERIAILSLEVERLQAELRSSDAARRAAENAARTSPWPTIARWNGENWPFLVGVLAAAGLATGGVLAWRRRKPRSSMIGEPPLMANSDSGLVDTYLDDVFRVPRPAPRFAAAQRPDVRAGQSDNVVRSSNAPEDDFDHDLTSLAHRAVVSPVAAAPASVKADEIASTDAPPQALRVKSGS
jgi:uncharacterized small protein (DUF1192 family)